MDWETRRVKSETSMELEAERVRVPEKVRTNTGNLHSGFSSSIESLGVSATSTRGVAFASSSNTSKAIRDPLHTWHRCATIQSITLRWHTTCMKSGRGNADNTCDQQECSCCTASTEVLHREHNEASFYEATVRGHVPASSH